MPGGGLFCGPRATGIAPILTHRQAGIDRVSWHSETADETEKWSKVTPGGQHQAGVGIRLGLIFHYV
jgi:hypothetical protein